MNITANYSVIWPGNRKKRVRFVGQPGISIVDLGVEPIRIVQRGVATVRPDSAGISFDIYRKLSFVDEPGIRSGIEPIIVDTGSQGKYANCILEDFDTKILSYGNVSYTYNWLQVYPAVELVWPYDV